LALVPTNDRRAPSPARAALHPAPNLGFTDRSARLVAFGILATLAGVALAGLGALGALLPFIGGKAGIVGVAPDPRAAAMGLVVHALLGAAFVSVGIGSVRRRRWAPPLMLTLSWTWLIGGLFSAVVVPGLVEGALTAAGPETLITGGVLLAVQSVVMLVVVFVGVLIPAAFVVVYRDPDAQRTCEHHDPRPSWTERCPASVLGLSVGLAACAALGVPMALQPAVPMFGTLVGGWPGGILILSGSALLGYLALQCYRLRPIGWWGTTAALVLLGVSTGVTFLRIDPVEIYREMGYPEDQIAMLRGALSGTLLAVYMIGIRKHWRRSESVNPSESRSG